MFHFQNCSCRWGSSRMQPGHYPWKVEVGYFKWLFKRNTECGEGERENIRQMREETQLVATSFSLQHPRTKNPLNQVLRLNPWWQYEGVLNTNIHTKSPHLEQDIHNSIQLQRVDGFIWSIMQQSEFREKDSVQKGNPPNESQFSGEKHGKVSFSAFICALSRKTTRYK
jgi:hypothetical protein